MNEFLEDQIVFITLLTQEITREPLLHVGPLQEFLGREMVDVGSRVRERMKALREQAEKEYFVLSDDGGSVEHSKKRELKKPGGDEGQPPRKNLANGRKKKSKKRDDGCMYACDEPSDTCVCCDLCERWFHAGCAGYVEDLLPDPVHDGKVIELAAFCLNCLKDRELTHHDILNQQREYARIHAFFEQSNQWLWKHVSQDGRCCLNGLPITARLTCLRMEILLQRFGTMTMHLG